MTDDEMIAIAAKYGVGPYSGLSLAKAIRRAALEEAAKACDEISINRWNLYKGRAPYTGSESGRADSYVAGESDGAERCADAIRALARESGEQG
ncbi:hypothetical protein J2803_001757 [Paraburkholderia phenoliruptrix]|nr:hypothetical protein [Paraburkholderia phenoliruptrix]